MPQFHFRLESGNRPGRAMSFDLPDSSVVGHVAKQVARRMASEQMTGGSLDTQQELEVIDGEGVIVARYRLGEFLQIF